MRHVRIVSAAVCGIVVAVVLPVAGAIYLAERGSVRAEQERVSLMARGLLRHIEEASAQATAAIDVLAGPGSPAPCSPESVALIRSLELSSSYLQAVGFVQDGRLACTGVGRHDADPLPPVDYISSRGANIRRNVALAGIPDVRFVLATDSATGVTGVIHGEMGFDLLAHVPGLSSGIVSRSAGEVIVHRGFLAEAWFAPRGDAGHFRTVADGYAIAMHESSDYDFGVYAARPLPPLSARLRSTAYLFVPVGLVVSALLILMVVVLARAQLSMSTALQLALRRDEFHLVYQPVVDLRTRAWVGVEALVRWTRPDGHVVMPDVFIPVAEDSGLIRPLTARVFELVLRDTAPLVARGEAFHIGVNVSAADLRSPEIVALVRRQVERAAGSGVRLIVEATERGLIDESECRDTIAAIRATGAAVAIDDFGIGYSSLSYLRSFDVDYLKIDRSFVDTIGTDAPTADVVHHIIAIADSMGLATVGEGVETEAQAAYLAERGVAYAQGWLFARPMPMEELLALLPAHEGADEAAMQV